jgi:hypothetical protein
MNEKIIFGKFKKNISIKDLDRFFEIYGEK